MNNTNIAWTKKTWNPFSGCRKVSPGCAHCYAETTAENKRWTKAFPNGFDLTYRWHKLEEPLKIKEPSVIFVNSMSDLYFEDVPFAAIDRVYAVMALAPWHTYQILTKRSKRQLEYLTDPETPKRIARVMDEMRRRPGYIIAWPLSCVWQGVSVENPNYLWRIDDLRQAPAFVRFISFEPLLGEIPDPDLSGIQWAIVGGESGPGYRPMQEQWARSLRDSCVRQGVAFFMKQNADYRPERRPWLIEEDGSKWQWHQFPDNLSAPVRLS